MINRYLLAPLIQHTISSRKYCGVENPPGNLKWIHTADFLVYFRLYLIITDNIHIIVTHSTYRWPLLIATINGINHIFKFQLNSVCHEPASAHVFSSDFVCFCFIHSTPRPRWVVPVLPKGELEVLLEAAIDLSKKGRNIYTFFFLLILSIEMLCGIYIPQSLLFKGYACTVGYESLV